METLRVRVRAKWLPDKSAKEGDELDLPNAEAHSLEKRGYVEILWQGTEAKDMGTKDIKPEPDVKPEEKKVAPIVKPAASKTVIKKSPPPKSKPKTGKK